MRSNFVIALLFGLFLSSRTDTLALADLIVLNPVKDNSMFAENSNLSNGTGGLFVGVTIGKEGTTIRRALLQFDLSGIPAGSTINSVSLRLERVIAGPSAGADILSIHPVTSPWGEGTSFGVGKGAPATTNDATWSSRFFNTTSTWATPGGDFLASSGTVTLDSANNEYTFSSQAGMLSDIQNWVDNPGANNGWLLKYEDESTQGTARYFGSRESAASSRPQLTVDFTAVPEPSSGLLIGAGVFVASIPRSRVRSFS